MKKYQLETKHVSIPIEEVLEKHVDVDKFMEFCKACPMYGTKWACPPFSFDTLEYWKKYRTLDIVLLKINYSDQVRKLKPEDQKELGTLIINKEKISMLDKLYLIEKEMPGSRVLSAGTCELCALEGGCTRPQNKPCRHPEHMRFSIEALGGDVVGMLNDYFDTPIKWTTDGSLPDYHCIVFGILNK